jgi:predicted lipoprotein
VLAGIIVALLSCSLAACKIEKTIVQAPRSETSVFINDASFNPDQMVEADWEAKVLPLLRAKAGPYDTVADAIGKDPNAAGQQNGYRAEATSPWTYAVKVEGTVTGANTESRAATLDVKTAGGQTVMVQIGPVIRGTAIRDMLAFRPFGSFKNQVDYAQYGKALNAKANATVLSKVPRQDLVGRTVSAVGAFQPSGAGGAPLITPVEITVGSKP